GTISHDSSGGGGIYYKSGDQFGAGTQTYTLAANAEESVYATGGNAVAQAVGGGAVGIAGALTNIYRQLMGVGGGAVSVSGALNRLIKIGTGGGAIGIAGALNRLIKIATGGAVTTAGALGLLVKKGVGGGAVGIAGVVVWLYKILVGNGAVGIAGALTNIYRQLMNVGNTTGTTKLLLGTVSPPNESPQMPGGYVIMLRFQATDSGNITRIKFKPGQNGTVKVAIYADDSGEPGSLLNAVNTATNVTADTEATITIANTEVVSGTYYWLAFAIDTGQSYYYTDSSSGARRYKPVMYSSYSFPNPAGSGYSGDSYDAYIAGCELQSDLVISGSLNRLIKLGVGGSLTIGGALNLLIKKSLSGSVGVAGALTNIYRQLMGVGGGAVSVSGALNRLIKIGTGGAVGIAGIVSSIFKRFVSVGGAVTTAGALGVLIKKTVGSGAVGIAGVAVWLFKMAVGNGAVGIAGALTFWWPRVLHAHVFTATYRKARAFTALYRTGKVLTSLYRKARAFTALYRTGKVLTSLYRKAKAFTRGG
ncbi:MAG: hypothetical protein PHQ43_09655, partial [Dehalococcoidales bacterium]|nr:hypothetical protein [Dehalococcoidales bacterium]